MKKTGKLKKLFLKKKPRPRTVAPLQEREKDRPKPEEKVIPFNSNAPKILVTRTERFTVVGEKFKNFPWKLLTVTFIIILLGGIGSATFQAFNADIRREITRSERQLRDYRNANFALEQNLQERYTRYEIERMATALGMTHPDPSQVISIYVPRVGGVTLNVAEYALPRHNYFWNDVREFLGGLVNQIFGG